MTAVNVLLPPSRFVQGSMHKAQDKDFEGRPRLYPANHPTKAGQPKISYFFAIAIPKAPTDNGHWANTSWGKDIWAFGHGAWPKGQAQSPGFAWKIEDGDSTVPNKRGFKNCDREGFPGNWIVNLSSSFPPKLYTRGSDGRAQELVQADAINPGDYVQVQATIDSNGTEGNPGIYINHGMVMFLGYGQRIRSAGADPNSVQWAAAPAGASAVPPGGTMPAAPAGVPTPGAPPAPGAALPPPPAPPGAYAAPPPPTPTPVVPAPSFITPPAPGAAAAPPPPPAAPAGPQMTAKAAGKTYAEFIAAGWSDALLRQHGYMV